MPPFAFTTHDDVMPAQVRVPVSVMPEHERVVHESAPVSVRPEQLRLEKDPVAPVRVPVIATVPSTDKLEASVVVVLFTRICHPYT